jgi:thymidylate synthase/predicted MPP superfamily phosphohydrolase
MKIIQVADLHINSETQIEIIHNKLNQLFNSLKTEIEKDEEIIFCSCGDIVDRGNVAMYSIAEEIFNFIKRLFTGYRLKFEFVPGNHDLCDSSFNSYDSFISKFIESTYSYNNKNTHLRKYENINLILSNSVYHRCKDFGKLDLESLEQIESRNPSFLVIHHTLLSENDNDSSAVRNAYKLVDYIEKNNIIGILHGHTHGYKDIMIGSQCNIIGVGPMFKEVADINNQFNFIEVSGCTISKITNYRYSADLNGYIPHLVYENNVIGQYSGSSLKETYDRVVLDIKRLDCIHNLKMNIATKYELFEKELRDSFSDFVEIAKDWQENMVPESLYYNHGQYMQSKGIWGIDYIIDELKNKATSSRAIIPLINFDDVVDSGDQFLPSLDIMQFGFSDDMKSKIFVTIYLRALEVNHFLKINLCEVYLMVKSIIDEIRSIEEVDITILAFKAQYKEKYGCFRKARIDTLSEAKLTRLLSNNNYQEIISLLKEKLELNETVIQDKGLNGLKNAIEELTSEQKCSSLLLEKVENTLKQLDLLMREREKTSNYKEIEKIEQLATASMNDLIAEFEKESGNLS